MALPPVVDAHHHLWDLHGSIRYPWLQDPVDPDRFTGDDTAIRVDYGVEQYRADVGRVPLKGSVHVDAGASDSLAEARWLDEVHRRSGLPTVIVASCDLSDPSAPAVLEELASMEAVRGIRHILNWHEDSHWSYVTDRDLMDSHTWRSAFARLAPLGLSFDLQVYPHQLLRAADLAAAFPETTVVLNHAGMPERLDPDHLELWTQGIRALAAQSNTYAKVSGIGMTIHPWTVETIRPLVTTVYEAFGPSRTAFGSNFPVDSLYSTYEELYEAFDLCSADLSESERADMFAGTAVRAYRMGVLPGLEVSGASGPPA
ncbi:MAG: amidohydrolase family protein [Actinobacteria bacterium]|nr:amidohydrolase family protein [Actinomycetota bacterium]